MLSFNFSRWGSIFQDRLFFCFRTNSLIPTSLFPTRERLMLSRLYMYKFISVSSEQEGCLTFLPIQLCWRELGLHICQGVGNATTEVSSCARSQTDPFFWNREGVSAGRLLPGPQISWGLGLWIWVLVPLLAADPAECGSSTATPVWIMQFRYSQPLQLFWFYYFGLLIIFVSETLQDQTAILWYAACHCLWAVISLHNLYSYIPI